MPKAPKRTAGVKGPAEHSNSLLHDLTAHERVLQKKAKRGSSKRAGPYATVDVNHADSDHDSGEEIQITDSMISKLNELGLDEFPAMDSTMRTADSTDSEAEQEFQPLDEEEDGFEFDLGAEDEETVRPAQQYRSLADYVFDAVDAKKRRDAEIEKMQLFSPMTRDAYAKVGQFLSRYRSGKLPKAFTLIPTLTNWVDVLWLTKPESWSPHAIAEATPIFVRGLKDRQAQKYLQYVVLPAVKKCIDSHQRLNVHLYEALKTALYKPSAWFKGIFFPTILEASCNYKTATILCSVLSKGSFPAASAGAALVILASHRPHTNVIGYAMIKLINKKHNLPLPVLTALVGHFKSFLEVDESPSVVWQQSLLTFAQRWKGDLSTEQKDELKAVMKKHYHEKITAEIRRELFGNPGTENLIHHMK